MVEPSSALKSTHPSETLVASPSSILEDRLPAPAVRYTSRSLTRWIWFLVLFCAVLGLGWLFRVPLLQGVANLWIVNDKPTHADAIIILGGGDPYRPIKAAELYRVGIAPVILIPARGRVASFPQGTGLEEKRIKEFLIEKGVAESDIQILETTVTNTHDEAIAIRDWSLKHHATKVVVPTDIFHTRRVHWVFGKMLREIGASVDVVAVNPPDYDASNWWRRENGIVFFQVETTKMLFYWIHY